MGIGDATFHCIQRKDLSRSEMETVIRHIMEGSCSDVAVAAFLTAMHMKGESLDEIVGAADVMRALSIKVDTSGISNVVDIVGTGGDNESLFNVSTASVFVAAAAGASVAKHGNRSVSSSSGSADLLQQMGVNLTLSPQQVTECLRKTGIGFLFAPAYHTAMKHVATVRKQLGFRTIFNVLGPLCNPAGVKRLMVGVFSDELRLQYAQAFHALDCQHVLIVHSCDGLDEISLADDTNITELRQGKITEYCISPEDFGLSKNSLDGLRVNSASESLQLIMSAFRDKEPLSERTKKTVAMIALNAGAAMYVAGVSKTLSDGVLRAREIIHSGEALKKMQELSNFCS
ncbi:Anthranilate phosphoribosyltransferase [invertebrate metagenome]|uniref:anthranilate phosphoribosyltransferase n=1 Tax=invertebrate metagenome TaxID=1711999 RepID=A0A2H9TCI8_9ZZZZ